MQKILNIEDFSIKYLYKNEKCKMLIQIETINPKVGDISIGLDAGELVDPKEISNYKFEGLMKRFVVYRQKMSESELKALSLNQ